MMPLPLLLLLPGVIATAAAHAAPPCSPAGLYFVNRDTVAHSDPITLNSSAGGSPSPTCPGRPVAGFVASTLRFWKDATVCQYANGSLWKYDGQTAAVGPGCHAIEWVDPPPRSGRFLWCRAGATRAQCVPVLPPSPAPAPPGPAPPPTPPAPAPAPPPFGPLYDPLPTTGVSFVSTDMALEGLVAHAAAKALLNIKPFRRLPDGQNLSIMVEGAQFNGAWLETQPMAGAMYATRDVRIAVDNQLVFMRAQSTDGYIPGQVGRRRLARAPTDENHGSGGPASGGIQGLFFASPAVDVAWYLEQAGVGNQTQSYAVELAKVLEGYDGWLWDARNTSTICKPHSYGCVGGAGHAPRVGYGRGGTNATACCRGEVDGTPTRGLLWTNGIIDSGEDSSTRFCKVANHSQPYAPCVESYAFPIQSADVTSYSYDCRSSLARLATLRGDQATAQLWQEKAQAVAENLKRQLWVEELGSMYSRDAADEIITTLVHDPIRVMWMGAFDQGMADAFVTRHIMNESEFWTPMPLPSISVSDPRYNALTPNANTWSGRPMGLTLQRAIRAFERYGHHTESVMVGLALAGSILSWNGCSTNASHCQFTLEIDPFSCAPMHAPWSPPDGYGPMIMALLEYHALRLGVVPRPPDASMGPLRTTESLLWSALPNVSSSALTSRSPSDDGDSTSNYTQRLGPNTYSLVVHTTASTATVATPTTTMEAYRNSALVFTASFSYSTKSSGGGGVRVVTSLAGEVLGLVGVSAVPTTVTLRSSLLLGVDGGQPSALTQLVKPNQEWRIATGGGSEQTGAARQLTAQLVRAAPYTPPFK